MSRARSRAWATRAMPGCIDGTLRITTIDAAWTVEAWVERIRTASSASLRVLELGACCSAPAALTPLVDAMLANPVVCDVRFERTFDETYMSTDARAAAAGARTRAYEEVVRLVNALPTLTDITFTGCSMDAASARALFSAIGKQRITGLTLEDIYGGMEQPGGAFAPPRCIFAAALRDMLRASGTMRALILRNTLPDVYGEISTVFTGVSACGTLAAFTFAFRRAVTGEKTGTQRGDLIREFRACVSWNATLRHCALELALPARDDVTRAIATAMALRYREPYVHVVARTRVMCQAGRARAAGTRSDAMAWLCERAPLWVVVHVCALVRDVRGV